MAKDKLIFIVGLGTSWHWWDKQVHWFSNNHHDEFEILVIDNRGIGKSPDIPFTFRYSMKDMANDIMHLLMNLQWIGNKEKFNLHLIAQSMGGLIATEMLRWEHVHFPQLTSSFFKTVTLQNSFRTIYSREATPMLDTVLFLVKSGTIGVVSLEIRMKYVLEQMFSSDYIGQHYEDLYKRYSPMFSDLRMIGQIKQTLGILTHYVSEKDFIEAYEKVDKVLLVASKMDRMVHSDNTPHMQRLLQNSTNVKRVLVTRLYDKESNGHIINSEQHEDYNDFLYKNLK